MYMQLFIHAMNEMMVKIINLCQKKGTLEASRETVILVQ